MSKIDDFINETESVLSQGRTKALEDLCQEMYEDGCLYWQTYTEDPLGSARAAWLERYTRRMQELGLLMDEESKDLE